ncbi:DNA topoisomerase 2-binding protein 1-B, partial [Orchesella cincta]
MFQACQSNFLPVRWIKDEECAEQIGYLEGSVFVFDPFGSDGYEALKLRLKRGDPRFEIFGPQVLRSVFNAPDILQFVTMSHPTYALAMRKMIISLSGFSRELKSELEERIRLMNGTISPSLTKSVTHVVTANAITNKSMEASREQIPIMIAEWVKKVWKDNQSRPVQASDPRYANCFCPLFYKVKVCLSQISAAKKATLKAAIERLGGTCSPDLVKGTTDVLVVTNAAGDKFKFAKRWKIPCVTPDWVENSTDQGVLLPFKNFKVIEDVDLAVMMSTPAHSHVPDLSLNFTRCSAVEDDQSKLVIDATTDFSRNNMETFNSHNDAVAQLKAAAKNTGSYLDGCRIYVVDYENCDELKR